MNLRNLAGRKRLAALLVVSLGLFLAPRARGQGPAPETAPTLFPGGALISYNSVFTTRGIAAEATSGIPAAARPTFSHEGDFTFTWGFRRNFDVTVVVPIVTNHFAGPAGSRALARGTGLGDAVALVKYRFYRRDSERGTTQASVTAGPKIPTGWTGLKDTNGKRAPAGLQPGSGSTDLYLAGNWTYTGLFNVRRLVADEEFRALVRTEGSQATRLGSEVESRFWVSYRPYESKDVAREWFIGPEITWRHSGDDRISGIEEKGSGGDALLAGLTSYVGLRPGLHAWVGVDWDMAHSNGVMFMPVRRHISFGITQQFRLHF